jgi:hypothetical protein
MKTNIYIDGFNLYYRAVKDTAYKWLDLGKMSGQLVPGHDIHRTRYFTALINGASTPRRQLIYLRALEPIPILSVPRGTFKLRSKTGPLVNPVPGLPTFVTISAYEEKGTDVKPCYLPPFQRL